MCPFNSFTIGSFPYIENPPSTHDQPIKLRANNQNVSLLCKADKQLFITWEKENDSIGFNRTVRKNSGIFTLFNLQPEDAGNYRCVVKDSFGRNCSSDYATITIKGNYITILLGM